MDKYIYLFVLWTYFLGSLHGYDTKAEAVRRNINTKIRGYLMHKREPRSVTGQGSMVISHLLRGAHLWPTKSLSYKKYIKLGTTRNAIADFRAANPASIRSSKTRLGNTNEKSTSDTPKIGHELFQLIGMDGSTRQIWVKPPLQDDATDGNIGDLFIRLNTRDTTQKSRPTILIRGKHGNVSVKIVYMDKILGDP